MTRTVQDADLRNWEAYPSSGRFGLPGDAKIVFHCLSDPQLRARYVRSGAEEDDAAGWLERASDEELLGLLQRSEELP